VNRRLLVGILVSIVLFYFSVRDAHFGQALSYLGTINPWYFIPYSILIFAEVLIRGWKWQLLLWPIKHCSFWKLSSATLIGLMANNILPARAGEFVRAYAGARLQNISYGTSFATVVIDRVLDGLTVTVIFLVTILLADVPDEFKILGYIATAIYLVALVVLIALLVREEGTMRLLATVLRPFPARLGVFVLRSLASFVHGLHSLRSVKLTIGTVLISIFIWVGYALSLYLTFLAFGIDLSFLNAFVTLLFLTILLTVPSTPGYFGAMEAGITAGLRFSGVDPSQALAVALVYHITQYLPITIGGLIAVFLEPISMSEITHVRPREPEPDASVLEALDETPEYSSEHEHRDVPGPAASSAGRSGEAEDRGHRP
jgi:glycosyltransferase 2 family protein